MKTKQTTIPYSIITGFTHERDNQIEQARQQIEFSSFYLQSLFNSIKHAAAHLESEVEESQMETCGDLRNIAEIGYAISNAIFGFLSEIEIASRETEQSSKPEEADTNSLAVALSEVLRHKNLSFGVYDGLRDLLNDVYNSADSEAKSDFESSPEYLKAILDAYEKNHGKEVEND